MKLVAAPILPRYSSSLPQRTRAQSKCRRLQTTQEVIPPTEDQGLVYDLRRLKMTTFSLPLAVPRQLFIQDDTPRCSLPRSSPRTASLSDPLSKFRRNSLQADPSSEARCLKKKRMDKRCQKNAFTERKKTQVKQKDEHLCIQEEKKKNEKESDLREPPSNPGNKKEIPP